MTPIQLIPAALLALTLGQATAQDRFIEVIVDDTMHRKVKEISYMVHSSPEVHSWDTNTDSSEDGATEETVEADKKKKMKEKQQRDLAVQEVFKKGGFTFTRESDIVRNYEFGSSSRPWENVDESDDNGYVVKLKSLADLDRLVQETSKVEGARGEIMWMTFDTNTDLAPEMLARLTNRAKAEAANLATAGGVKLGTLISACDHESNVGTDIMDLVLRLDIKSNEKDMWRQVQGIYTRKMRFRFAVL